MKLTARQIKHYAREAAATIGVVLTTTNAIAWPASVRATVFTISGVLLTAEHVLSSVAHNKTKTAPKIDKAA
jgi:hypothetical protein